MNVLRGIFLPSANVNIREFSVNFRAFPLAEGIKTSRCILMFNDLVCSLSCTLRMNPIVGCDLKSIHLFKVADFALLLDAQLLEYVVHAQFVLIGSKFCAYGKGFLKSEANVIVLLLEVQLIDDQLLLVAKGMDALWTKTVVVEAEFGILAIIVISEEVEVALLLAIIAVLLHLLGKGGLGQDVGYVLGDRKQDYR